jgi:hypothetical protein
MGKSPERHKVLIPFQNAIGRLLIGQSVGCATKDFNEKFAAPSTSLSNLLEQTGFGVQVSDFRASELLGRAQ